MRALTSWGRASVASSRVWPVAAGDDAVAALAAAGARGAIARGYGRSYGDPCLNDGGEVLDVRPLRAILALDEATGVLQCEAGASFRDVVRRTLPAGWLPPVCPGTAFVSMGGAIANDVHGKNQHTAGTFGDHLDWFDLLTPSGEVRRVTRDGDPTLFSATLGGIGLTGVILRVQLRLVRVGSNAMDVDERRVPDLDALLAALDAGARTHPYVVAWVDALAQGKHLGRGVVETARHADADADQPPVYGVRIPLDLPEWVLSRPAIRAFNAAYRGRVPAAGRTRRITVERFLFPLDALEDWNRLYGRSGLYQFQCAVPLDGARVAVRELLEEVHRSRGGVFLAVMKRMVRSGNAAPWRKPSMPSMTTRFTLRVRTSLSIRSPSASMPYLSAGCHNTLMMPSST
jgi:decaprenylphospho-beta-D-ribofuranose 2-oxidase